ncbi:MAG: SPASM domain-containing protein [Humidesulfovibrio sp.]|uniref:radical SAM/SPASM domain-containing protein n=1 Tax=Humidesulfovibrio sp. TaxID=2910988 RepID=UPI0027E84810|nr:SPASM domain-containing protein [Humidesulfovibrio sp.]MDQ7836575.1 SPASM domain-containing protein [Humidesulfovibrio sp.]
MAEYFMPEPMDGALKKLWAWVSTGKRFRPAFPRAVQFQTLSACNARCAFCPHGQTPREVPHGRMDDAIFYKIVDECSRHFITRISPYLTNEPLLDERMPRMLSYITKKKMPGTKTKINSNGALLTHELSREILASGLDSLWFSVNGYSPETYRASMDLDLDRTLGNIDAFLDLRDRIGGKRPRVVITTLHTRIVEPELDYARKYWEPRGVVFKIHHMDNRAGEVVAGNRPGDGDPALKRGCDLFLKQAYIVENGDMILCCHDWRQSVVVGNIRNRSIAEVWNSERFTTLIREYFAEDFSNLEICRACR